MRRLNRTAAGHHSVNAYLAHRISRDLARRPNLPNRCTLDYQKEGLIRRDPTNLP